MGDKEVPYREHEICDICGHYGAFDFYGDYVCEECLMKNVLKIDDYKDPIRAIEDRARRAGICQCCLSEKLAENSNELCQNCLDVDMKIHPHLYQKEE